MLDGYLLDVWPASVSWMFGVGCISTSAHKPVVYNIKIAMASGVSDLCFELQGSGIYVGDIGSVWERTNDNASRMFS